MLQTLIAGVNLLIDHHQQALQPGCYSRGA